MLHQSLEGERGPNSILPVAFWPPALREQMPVVLIHPVLEMPCYCSPRNVTGGYPGAPQPTPGDIVSQRVSPLTLLCSWDTSDPLWGDSRGVTGDPCVQGARAGVPFCCFPVRPVLAFFVYRMNGRDGLC